LVSRQATQKNLLLLLLLLVEVVVVAKVEPRDLRNVKTEFAQALAAVVGISV
jgi:hypothetical protein